MIVHQLTKVGIRIKVVVLAGQARSISSFSSHCFEGEKVCLVRKKGQKEEKNFLVGLVLFFLLVLDSARDPLAGRNQRRRMNIRSA